MLKKTKLLSILCSSLFFAYTAYAESNFAFPFIGKWNSADTPITLDQYDYQDIQNLRTDGKRLKGVRGHTKINTSAWSGDYPNPLAGFHFRKVRPTSETHVIVQSADNGESTSFLFDNTTTIPNQGSFAAATLHTDGANAGVGRFSPAPNGHMAYANNVESKLWAGDESYPLVFFTLTQSYTAPFSGNDPADYSDAATNSETNSTDTVLLGGGGNNTHTKLLLHCDGDDASTTFTDEGTTGHTVTANGSTQLDIDYKKFGPTSGLFDGTGDYLTVPDHADWDVVWETDFTVDMWVKHNTHVGADYYMEHWEDADNGWHILHRDLDGASDGIEFEVRNTASGTIVELRGGEIEDGSEHHIAIVKNGNEYGIYKDGVQVAYASDSDADVYTGTLYIGDSGAGSIEFDGWMDEVRIQHTNIFNASPNSGKSDTITVPTRAYRTDAPWWIVGTSQPLEGMKYYVQTANTETSTLTAKEWTGADWSDLAITDNTASGGVSLAQTGTVTWDLTGDAGKKFIGGYSTYWYMFNLSAGNSEVYQVTVDAPMSDIPNIWSGEEESIGDCQFWDDSDSTYDDCTNIIQSDITTDVLELDSAQAADYLLLGFSAPQQALHFYIPGGKGNSNAVTSKSYYWAGDAWTEVSDAEDGTVGVGDSLSHSGYFSFNAITAGQEFGRSVNGGPTLYYYKFTWDAQPDAESEIYHITGVPNEAEISDYKFPLLFQNRLFLFSEINGESNKALYSVDNAPYIWNGSDSGHLWFGPGNDELSAAAVVHNVFLSETYEQLVVTSRSATYRVFGSSPDDWDVDQISGDVGCNAPMSMTSCSGALMPGDSQTRNVAVWQSSGGIEMSDGARIVRVSDNVRNYWDPNSSDYIPVDRQDDSYGQCDSRLGKYKILVSSGSGQTDHNVELEYDLRGGSWTKIYREKSGGANPLQIALPVSDTSGNQYLYGATDEGVMYRLENGDDWAGEADIDQYVHTKDFFLATGENQVPFFQDTTINWIRLMFEDRATSDNITFSHYCNGTLSVNGTNEQDTPDSCNINAGPIYTTDVTLGPCRYHSFKIGVDTDAANGLELTGFGMVYDAYRTITED